MEKNYKSLALIFMLLSVMGLKAQFNGAFAVANWGTAAINSDGITNTSGAPASIYMVSGDNYSQLSGTNDFTIMITQTGFITFDWSYSTGDDPAYDWPEYVVNGVSNTLSNYSFGLYIQSGSQPCIPVTAGQVFGFRMYTVDNDFGPATCTFSNFSFSTGNLTITPASPTVCPGNTVALTASGGNNVFTWSGGISNGVPFTPTGSGIYTVTSGQSGCQMSKTVSLVYNPPLTISGPTSNICANTSATLSGPGSNTYTWSTGAVSQSIVITPVANVTYTISGISPQGCNTSGVRTFTVDPGLPVVTTTLLPSASVCPGKTVSLNAGGATSYTWSGGVPTVTNGVAFPISTTTTYTVTGGNSCGTTTAAVTASVLPLPTVVPASSSPNVCSGSTLALTVSGNASTYNWLGGATTITSGVAFVPAASTTYTVIGTSAQSCTASATIQVTVSNTPTNVPVASPALLCLGSTGTLVATGATSYTWSSSTQTVYTSSMVVTPTNTGSTTYTVTKSIGQCSDTKTINITTNAPPQVSAIAMPSTVCALSAATLAVGGALTYTWTAPGTPNYTFTGSSNVVSAPVSTTYSVAASDGSCVTTATVLLTITPNPTIQITTNTTSICMGQSVTLNASGASNYTWTASTGTFYGQSITQSPTTSILYNVIGDNASGCTAQNSQAIIVNSGPALSVTASKTSVCNGAAVTLTASGANTYTWDASTNYMMSNVVTVNPMLQSTGVMIYTVQGTNALNCIGSGTVQVAVFIPTLSVSGNTNACSGGTVSFVASGANSGSYSWNTGSGPLINQAGITATVTAATVYTVSASTTSLTLICPIVHTVAVGMYPAPNINATAERTTICVKESVELYGSGAASYTWNTGASGATIVVTPSLQTNYTVTGTDNNGCVSTATVQVRTSGCNGLSEFGQAGSGLIVYPNPNNGTCVIQSDTDIRLVLVNELGQFVQSIELSAGNANKVSVTDLAKGIYFLSGTKGDTRIFQKIVVAE